MAKITWARAFIKTTDSQHSMIVAENILNQELNQTIANQAWVADITYIVGNDWLHLSVVMDVYSRKIVGYSLSSRITADLVCSALQVVVHTKKPAESLMMYTDRARQYCSEQ